MILASLETVQDLQPAENATALESVTLKNLAWPIVHKKGMFSIGDIVAFIRIDTVVALANYSRFLFKDETQAYTRVNKVRLRGNLSMGIIVPLDQLSEFDLQNVTLGTEIGHIIGVSKYDKPVPQDLKALGEMPSYIPKTDEDNLLAVPALFDLVRQHKATATLKLDGSSMTVFRYNQESFVCSRRIVLKPDCVCNFTTTAKKYDLMNLVPEGFAIQGELVGPDIQQNTFGLMSREFRIFNVYDIEKAEYLGLPQIKSFVSDLNLKTTTTKLQLVPEIVLPDVSTIEELQQFVNTLVGPNGEPAEGIVVRSADAIQCNLTSTRLLSYKLINQNYND